MRRLTWYFVVAIATAFICLLLTAPATPAEPSPRVVAALAMTFEKAKAPCSCETVLGKCLCTPKDYCESGRNCPVVAAVLDDKAKGCTCGCEKTGKCVCPDCDTGNKGAYPGCICGCVSTGKCVCHDCNHPHVAPIATQPPKQEFVEPVVGKRHFYQGKWWTYKDDGYWHADVDSVSVPVYRPVQVVNFSGNGNCVSG